MFFSLLVHQQLINIVLFYIFVKDLAEVYRVIYNGPVEHLRGAILTSDVDTGFQLLFKDKALAKYSTREIGLKYINRSDYIEDQKELDVSSFPLIEDGGNIMLNGPIEASIGVSCGFCISFYLFGDIHRTIATPCPRGYPDVFSVPLKRVIHSEDGNQMLTMLYAFFENAVEAHVAVKITGVKSDFDFYGVIAARTSAITDIPYSSILFFKDEDEKMSVKSGDDEIDIDLSRRIVGVPLGSLLILQFHLFSNDKNVMVREKVAIDVQNKVQDSPYYHPMSCGNCGIRLEIKWRCQRGPNTIPAYEWSDSD